MSKGNVASFLYSQFWKRYDEQHYGQIANPSAAVGPVTSHALLCRDPIRSSIPAVERAIAEFYGGAGQLGKMTLGVDRLGDFEFEAANLDATLMTLANQSSIDTTTVTGWKIFGPNHANPVLENLGIAFTTRFQDRTLGTDGNFLYLTIVAPNVEMEIDLTTVTREGGRNPSPTRGVIRPTFSEKFPNGVAFGTNQDFTENKTDYFYIIADNPIGFTIFIADGVLTTFTLGYLPAKSTVATGNTGSWYTKNAVATAPTSVSTSTGAVVIDAGSANDVWQAGYETRFVAAA